MRSVLSNIKAFVASAFQPTDLSLGEFGNEDMPQTREGRTEVERINSFVHVNRNIYLSLFDTARSSLLAHHELNHKFLIIPFSSGLNIPFSEMSANLDNGPVSLAEIYNFDCVLQALERQNPDTKLVICTGVIPAIRTRAVLLLGCHLILSGRSSLKGTCRAFRPLLTIPDCPLSEDSRTEQNDESSGIWADELTAASCWGAISAAVAVGLTDAGPAAFADGEGELFAEYLHYSK